ncbi:MAG: hypothetical protein LUG55_04935 [Clostridiales bacterium]|nr:hypothetical protein [Clostridiales bacterium]
MIIYATKQTVERYKMKMPEEFTDPTMGPLARAVYQQEQGDRLLEWGAKLFYFDRRKCVQVCNFASKFTVVLVDFKKADMEYAGNAVAHYMMDIYDQDKEMVALLNRFFRDYPLVCFGRLTDRKTIASLNQFQTRFLEDGYRLYDYIEGNILHTRKLNRDINTDYLMTEKVNGKTQYFLPAEKFATLLKERYAGQMPLRQ